jgi:hypothetical protein
MRTSDEPDGGEFAGSNQEFDNVISNCLHLWPEGTLEYLAVKDGSLHRVKEIPQ